MSIFMAAVAHNPLLVVMFIGTVALHATGRVHAAVGKGSAVFFTVAGVQISAALHTAFVGYGLAGPEVRQTLLANGISIAMEGGMLVAILGAALAILGRQLVAIPFLLSVAFAIDAQIMPFCQTSPITKDMLIVQACAESVWFLRIGLTMSLAVAIALTVNPLRREIS